MRSWVLEVKHLPGKHDAGAIKNAVQDFMTSWGLRKDKCVKVLRDGASNGSKACDLLGLCSMSCLAHCLYLIVGSGIVKQKFETTAEQPMKAAETDKPLQPTTDCATRWNSTHAMLARMLELRTTLEYFFEYERVVNFQIPLPLNLLLNNGLPFDAWWFYWSLLRKLLLG
ncbi:LOW QUALITY PROTEIN: Zinc finger BED domain-containing hypothetical protein [Phytophthora megakarya]|uniref:Uncharacterized protein n=1 Tax=Phytophthora megakarya TaxID=4795 RepID=A0A225UXL2_9STRA|nr:LOW QUALITY PROTEIN: Zinc finger BED domain-containing hypothetical protein [Phytophthora megakarya]